MFFDEGAIVAKTRISIYLVKQGITESEKILKLDKCVNFQKVEGVGALYSKMSSPKTPDWVGSFFGDAIDASHLTSSSASAVFLVPISFEQSQRIFALTFGYGYTLLEQDAIEERFGLKTALNLAEANSLRKIKRTTVAGNALKSNEQLPKRSSIGEFSLDAERDLLDGVTVGITGNDVFSGNVDGADSFNVSVEAGMHNIVDILSAVFEAYCSDAYKESFDWIDRISQVKSPSVISKLNAAAVGLINDCSPDIWMAVPEVIEWEKVSGFKVTGDETLYQDILIDKVVASIRGGLADFSQLKNRQVKMLGTESSQVLNSWSSDRCLFGEISFGGNQYCINGGKWYQIDLSFARHVNNAYNEIPVSDIAFPDCAAKMKEGEYNKVLAESGGRSMALMDARNISYGGGRSRIELCDVLTDDYRFIHVKHYSGSSVLSHLFNQGLVSAELMTEPDFRKKANQKLRESCPGFDVDLNGSNPSEVVYGIITNDETSRPNIPFFSKVTFDHVANRLRMMGIKVSIKAIHQLKQAEV